MTLRFLVWYVLLNCGEYYCVPVLNILSGQAAGSQLQQQVEVSCEDEITATGDNIAFTVLSKKGNKQQVIPSRSLINLSLHCWKYI